MLCRPQEAVVRSHFLWKDEEWKSYYGCSEIHSNFHYLNVTDINRPEEGLGRKSSSPGFVLHLPR